MHRFQVWAPGKGRLEVVVDGRRAPMHGRDGGWWEAAVEQAGPGSRYGFSLEGGEVRPDPRSPSQPDGVLSLSEVVDHGAHLWSDSGWRGLSLPGLVIYELHVGTFSATGTFDGVIEHLPHLVELGVDAIEVMPIAEFSGDRGWGYDGVDLFAPHHAYGGPDGFKRLVDACHAAGLGVLLDVVYNHLGPVGNFLSQFGPYFTARHHTPWGDALNFDGPESQEVRRFVIDNALMWIRDYHVDGLRLDAVFAIDDESPVHILDELVRQVKTFRPGSLVIAEADVDGPRYVQSYGFDAAWADDWHHALHASLTGERRGYYRDFGGLEQLGRALNDPWLRGPKAPALSPQSSVVSTQNHDQVGNRPAGDRLRALVGEGKAKIAAALLLTSQFTPMLFQGEEWAASTPFLYFTNHADPTLGRAVFEGRKREFASFGWHPDAIPDPQDPASFQRSKLRWDELKLPEHDEMLEWYRRLLQLRRSLSARHDRIEVEVDCNLEHVLFKREGIAVRANLGSVDWPVAAPEKLLLSSAQSPDAVPPDGVAVYSMSGAGA